jgi:hypothetical protein
MFYFGKILRFLMIRNPNLTNYRQNAYLWTGQGCGRIPARVSVGLDWPPNFSK